MKHQLLHLGHVVATPAALAAIRDGGQSQDSFLDHHVRGCATGTRLLSAHKTLRGRWVWIVTEADRSLTTILLPSECRKALLFRLGMRASKHPGPASPGLDAPNL
jgi:hypothetical protein